MFGLLFFGCWFIGFVFFLFLVYWFHCFLVSQCLGVLVSKFQNIFNVSLEDIGTIPPNVDFMFSGIDLSHIQEFQDFQNGSSGSLGAHLSQHFQTIGFLKF